MSSDIRAANEILKDFYGGTNLKLIMLGTWGTPSWAEYRKARQIDEAKLHAALRAHDAERVRWLRSGLAGYDMLHWPQHRYETKMRKFLLRKTA